MKRIAKYFAAILSVILLFNIFGLTATSAEEITHQSEEVTEEYDRQLDKVYEEYKGNQSGVQSEFDQNHITPFAAQPASIGHIIKFTIQQLFKRGSSVAVQTTTRNVITNLTKHAIEEAIKDGITTLMIDNLLEGKASGMRAVEKYVDIQTGARVVYDPNNKIIAILDNSANDVITIYSDNGKDTINYRVNVKKRWFKSMWNFK
ncbi:DUF4258 domain-containing protein [Paenibacillus peoriae]|uniref:DUF4258 domain-containing protein n=1 Tax=Paenibacillus peoriae TaxID=59893 RepID=UPI00096E325E|nr:DUF4258 domain-containing protein [Paenibacillus peoriae]OMF32302.1 hypothetical protein BK134_10755 [Paenibacillus peoriae]